MGRGYSPRIETEWDHLATAFYKRQTGVVDHPSESERLCENLARDYGSLQIELAGQIENFDRALCTTIAGSPDTAIKSGSID
jgi:uncharacterized membrane-anchored protein YhcB (DUF1043 family)